MWDDDGATLDALRLAEKLRGEPELAALLEEDLEKAVFQVFKQVVFLIYLKTYLVNLLEGQGALTLLVIEEQISDII